MQTQFRLMVTSAALVAAAAQAEVPLYRVHDLGVLPGGVDSGARAINDRGDVAGDMRCENGTWQAFLYRNGQMQGLGTLGWRSSFAADINNRGDVVGRIDGGDPGSPVHRPFLYRDGRMIDLQPVLDVGQGFAWGINNSGHIVGVSDKGAFFYDGSRTRFLEIPGGSGSANELNDQGAVVGRAYLEDCSCAKSFVWRDDVTTVLPDPPGHLPGYDEYEARDINNAGQILVHKDFSYVSLNREIIYSDGVYTAINFGNGSALDINERGWVVGYDYYERAMLYRDGESYRLNDLLVPEDAAHWDWPMPAVSTTGA